MLKKLLILPPLMLGIAVLYYFISNKKPPAQDAVRETVRLVRVIEIKKTSVVPKISGFGEVRPARVWSATAQVSGQVTFVHAKLKKGAILKAGTEIVRISPADYELAIAQAKANIRAADARIGEFAVTEQNTGQILKIEKRALVLLQKDMQRKRTLLAKGTVAQNSLDKAVRDVLTQRKKVQDLENILRVLPSQRAVQQEQKAVNEAQLKSAELNLARTHIRLPFDARISEANVEITQFVQAGKTLVVADSIAVAEVEAQIPVLRFRRMAGAVTAGTAAAIFKGGIKAGTLEKMVKALGIEVSVRLGEGQGAVTWQGRFARVSDVIDPKTRTVGVIAAIDGAYADAVPGRRPPLSKGLFVELELRARAVPGQIIVPRSAVHDGKVRVVNGENRLEIRAVSLGFHQGSVVIVAAGLKAGEKIVVSDLSPAIAGMALKSVVDRELMAAMERQVSAGGPVR